MPAAKKSLPAIARLELEQCCRENVTAAKTRLRLAKHGVMMPPRTVARHMAECRTELLRRANLREIGIGAATVNLNLAPAAAVLQASAPDWRERQADLLMRLFDEFILQPTSEGFCALTIASYTLLVSESMNHLFPSNAKDISAVKI